MKKFLSLVMSICLVSTLVISASATNETKEVQNGCLETTSEIQATSGKANQIDFVVFDKDGNVVQSGIINPLARATYNPVTIPNGGTARFCTGLGLRALEGTLMKFCFDINKPASVQYFWARSNPSTNTSSMVKSSTAQNTTGIFCSFVSESSSYYYSTGVNNFTSEPITLYNVSITF